MRHVTHNFVCECGLCSGTLNNWENHSAASGHKNYTEETIAKITANALNQIEGKK